MKKVSSRAGKAGLPPGSLVLVADELPPDPKLHLFVYNAETVEERHLSAVHEFDPPEPGTRTAWLDIDGLNSERFLSAVSERFALHPLMVEDILNTDHRPKVEEYPDALFVVAKMLALHPGSGELDEEQICFVLRPGLVISFQQRPGDVLEPIRERLRKNLGRVRRCGSDYLLYALLDVIVDQYFLVVEELGRRIGALEEKVATQPGNGDLITIQRLRAALIAVNRQVTPTRELAGRLYAMDTKLIDKPTRRYLNDLQDHTVYIAETIAMFRDLLGSVENAFHAGQNARMTQVMKLLTIISTIFIPLTFIVGIYGMNFDHMPELRWRYGYFGVLAAMLTIAVSMLVWFKRRRWL